MDERQSLAISKHQTPKKPVHSTSQRNITYTSHRQCNMPRNARMKNHSTCSLLEESKTNEFRKVHLSKRKKRSRPRTRQPIILINKFQMSLANYIQEYKSKIKLCGTKRFSEKSGEYYLNNVQLEQNPNYEEYAILPTLSLREPTNLVNCFLKANGLSSLSLKAEDILTKLPDNSLTPIPTMSKLEIKNKYEGKKLSNAERTAVHIRRLEYSTIFQRKERKISSQRLLSIILIQQWWKVMFSIIRIQKFYRGRCFRRRLLEALKIEETELERILYFEKACDDLFIRRCLYQLFNSVGIAYRFPVRIEKISVKKSLLHKTFRNWIAKTEWNNNMNSHYYNEDDSPHINDSHNDQSNQGVIRKLIDYKRNVGLLPLVRNANRHLAKAIMNDFFARLKANVPYLNYMPQSTTIKTKFQRKRHPSLKHFYEGEKNDNDDDVLLFRNNDMIEGFTVDKAQRHRPLEKHFNKWIDYLDYKADVNRIVSSLIYMICSNSNSKRFLTQSYGLIDKQKEKYAVTNPSYLQDKYIYYKKTPSIPSHLEDSCSIHSNSNPEKNQNKSKVQKTNSNQLQSLGDECTEVKALLTIERDIKETQTEPIETKDECVGPGGEDRNDFLAKLIKKRQLREAFIAFCSLDPVILSKRTETLLLKKYHRTYVYTTEFFAKLGKKKFYYDHWKYSGEKKLVLKGMISKGDIIRSQCKRSRKLLKLGSVFNMRKSSSQKAKSSEPLSSFEQWKNYTQRVIQNELLSFELMRVVESHHQKSFLQLLKTIPLVHSAKKNKINSITNRKLMRLQIEEEIKSKKGCLNKANKFKFMTEKHFSTGFEETKSKYGLHTLSHSHSPFQKNDEQYNDHLARNKTVNILKAKRELFISLKLSPSKADSEGGGKDNANEIYDLIPDNKETFAPTIYSSQSFYLKKDANQPAPQTSKIHSDFISLFDQHEPVVDCVNTQRIQVTKATVVAEEEASHSETDDVLKKRVIERCSRDIDKREKPKKDNAKFKSPDQFYALPFNDNLREQLNVANDEDLQQFALINHGKIYNTKSTLTNPNFKVASTDIEITTSFSPQAGSKKRRNKSCSLLPEKERVFQLTEINTTQFYHTPIKESPVPSESSLGTIGMYTNVSKSTRRGKKPLFHKKSTENSILSSSLLSTIQQEKPNHSTKNLVYPKSDASMMKPSLSTKQYDSDSYYVTQVLSNQPYHKNDLHHNQPYFQFDNSVPLGNNAYQQKMNYDVIHYYPQKCLSSKEIHSKAILFQSMNEKDTTHLKHRSKGAQCIIYKSGEPYDCHFFFYQTIRRLFIQRLVSEATKFRKKDNLFYLLKITFHFKRFNQLEFVLKLIRSWYILAN